MNIRLKAALITAGMIACSFVSVLAVYTLINTLSPENLVTLAGVAFIGIFVYIVYGINLSRLKFEERIKEIRSQK